MKTQLALASLALDLRRVAQSYHRGSTKVAERFSQEALKRIAEIDPVELKPYLKKLLHQVQPELSNPSITRKAESALMLSTMFQNYAQKVASDADPGK